MKSFFRALLVLIVSLPIALLVQAQEEATLYIISSNQGANVRTCPRLTCDIAFHLEPGEELGVLEIVAGDVVTGSTDWLRVHTETGDVYVHSSLATPPDGVEANAPAEVVEAAPPQDDSESSEANPPTVEGSFSSADTSGWKLHRDTNFTIEVPESLEDGADLLRDEDLLRLIADAYGFEPKELYRLIDEGFESGLIDVILFDYETGAALFITHEDLGDIVMVPTLLKRAFEAQADEQGAEIISSETISLPAGRGARIRTRDQDRMGSDLYFDNIDYGIIINDQIMYDFQFTIDTEHYDDFEPIMERIMHSVVVL